MLGKLLKYEFKAQYKLYLGVWAAVLLFAGTAALGDIFNNIVFSIISGMSVILTVIASFAMFIMTLVLSVYRYYTNLIKDEGYLMHTLPVKPIYLHIVKLIVPVIYFIVDVVIFVLAISLMGRSFDWINSIVHEIQQEGLITNAWGFILLAVYMIAGILISLSQFYACLNVGSLSASNKGVMAFVAYIVCYVINQILSLMALLVSFIVLSTSNSNWMDALQADVVPTGYFSMIYILSGILGIIFLAAYNIISGYIITKKVNLE